MRVWFYECGVSTYTAPAPSVSPSVAALKRISNPRLFSHHTQGWQLNQGHFKSQL